MFASWLHGLKGRCEGVELNFEILNTELLDESVREESLRFEVSVLDPSGVEEKAFSQDTAKKLVHEARRRTPNNVIRVKVWHWANPVVVPPLDQERLGYPLIELRRRQVAELSNVVADVYESERRILTHEVIVRGILDGVLSLNLNLGQARTEHEVRNIVLRAFGREAPPVPENWEFQTVIEFADGGEVILVDEDRVRANKILAQELARRRKQRLPLDAFLRRRRRDDRLVTYIHPAPTRGGRKPKLRFGEWTDGAGI